MKPVYRLLVAAALCSAALAGAHPAGAATGSTSLIQGSGSSWAAGAVEQWTADVSNQGLQVVYTANGDAQGRQDFANRTVDFSVTSEGYQGVDPLTGVSDTSNGRAFSYLPIAAGGTSFPYHIVVDGRRVENLRLSGETLIKIFTNRITKWNDAAITADNHGVALPNLPIVPVVQSEGSGSTAQLTTYFADQFPNIWKAYSGSTSWTEYYPRQGNQIAQNGSNSAMNYIASSEANGAIGYVEYYYPLVVNYPVAKVLNSSGFYTLPTQYNVAVALEKAQIDMNQTLSNGQPNPHYLLQTLNNVYTDSDPRTYPLSSYVYMIQPTGAKDSSITDSKRQAIADFEYYSICEGQKEIGPLGYSPLPVNLVEAGFGQLQALKQASPSIQIDQLNIQNCNNPTFVPGQPNTNYLAQIAPSPPSCDKVGAGPCAAGVTPNGIGATPTQSGTLTATPSGRVIDHTSASPSAAGTSATRQSGTGGVSPSAVPVNSAVTTTGTGDPASGSAQSGANAGAPPLVSATLPLYRGQLNWFNRIAPVTVAAILLLLGIPVGVRRLRRRPPRPMGR